ncbi:hypothetical protein TELCIR_20500, partial [Teladorsagia circumcincta]
DLLESRSAESISRTESKSENDELYDRVLALRELCMRFLPTVRKHCVGERTEKKYLKRCEGYFSVSVPIKQGELGKPIGVDVGLGVGPYYQQNQHIGVDWMNGQVGTNFGIGVPFAGVGFNTGTGVVFPSVNTFAGYG